MFKFRKKSHQEVLDNIPNHIGIIMDGNGRWAKKRLQPRVMGHKAGMDALQKVTIEASQLGVKVLTVYAFSTENWSRPQDEVKFIMNLPVEFFNKYVPELDKNNVRILTIGDNSRLPKETLDALEDKLPYLYRDPDLIIRTSGELRLSNFLPWQSAYSEFYFTDVFWPDFDQQGLHQAISDYNKRHRRFGGV